MNKRSLLAIIEALENGHVPVMRIDDFPCFSPQRAEGNPNIDQKMLQAIAESLGREDICVFSRAVQAIEEGDIAWLGFKIVYGADAALANRDNDVTKRYGEKGSADGAHMVFFCNDAKEIVSSRQPSPRDFFQMKDCTRGPSMHTEQFPGLTWCSVPLHKQVTVWLLGASDVASEVALLANHVGFNVIAVDCDAEYLNEKRFPCARRILIDGFDDLSSLQALPEDYVCVLTRGHMFDPQGCLWAVGHGVSYIGMMGCKGKNDTVHDLVVAQGMTEDQWESIKRPIGLKFGAKTPAELAIAIVAELIDVRYRQRYSQEARSKHEENLGL